MSDYRPLLKWRLTWPGEETEDFVAHDREGNAIGRFYRHHTGKWYWTMNADDFPPVSGFCSGSAREACRLVEQAYYRASKA